MRAPHTFPGAENVYPMRSAGVTKLPERKGPSRA
jgi:hypothetical protein